MHETIAKSKSLTVQATWILCAKIISYALGIAVPLLLSRRLEQTEFGLYKQVFLILATTNALLSFNFGMSAYYFFPRETTSQRRGAAMFNILLFHIIVGGIAGAVLFLEPQVLGAIFHDEQMTVFAPILGIVIALWLFSNLLETVVVANQEPRLAMIFIVTANLSKAIFFIAAAVFFGTINSLIWAAMAQAVLQSCYLLYYANSRFPQFWRNWDFGMFREQFFYILPFGVLGWLFTLQSDLHNYFVSNRYTAAEYAVYAVGCFDLPLIAMLAESAAVILIPLMSRLQSADDRREIIETFVRVMRKLALIYFPLYAFLIVTADTFISTLFTEKFAASVPIFRLNLTLLPFLIITLDPIVRAYKQLGYFVLRIRIVLFGFMIFALWQAATFGDLLAVNAVVVCFALLERFVTSYKVLKTIGWQKSDWRLLGGTLKTALASAVAGLLTFIFYVSTNNSLKPLLQNNIGNLLTSLGAAKLAGLLSGAVYLGLCAVIFAPIYLSLIYLSNAIEKDEKEKLFRFIKNKFKRKREKAIEFADN